jgi:hypothetical protein
MVKLPRREHKKEKGGAVDLVELRDYRFATQMDFGTDSWCLYGRVFGHPNFRDGEFIYTSTPTAFDRENLLLTTASGREYRLVNPEGNAEDTWGEIELTIGRKGYKSW